MEWPEVWWYISIGNPLRWSLMIYLHSHWTFIQLLWFSFALIFVECFDIGHIDIDIIWKSLESYDLPSTALHSGKVAKLLCRAGLHLGQWYPPISMLPNLCDMVNWNTTWIPGVWLQECLECIYMKSWRNIVNLFAFRVLQTLSPDRHQDHTDHTAAKLLVSSKVNMLWCSLTESQCQVYLVFGNTSIDNQETIQHFYNGVYTILPIHEYIQR